MRKLILALALIPAAAGCVDRGACLASHTEHTDGYSTVVTTPVFGPNGTVSYAMIPQYIPESDNDVCDRWEFPDGRPEGR